jgi:two-component system, cell cycle sensor histidine kinase and response regulator CckA
MVTRKGKPHTNDLLDNIRDMLSKISSTGSPAFWMAAPDYSEMLYLAPSIEKIYGVPLSDMYHNPRLWLVPTDPQDRADIHEVVMEDQDGRRDVERRFTRPDGSMVWVFERTFPVTDERGAVLCLVGFSEDITERKKRETALLESEIRYRTLIETSTDGIAVVQDDKMVFFNDLLVERTGFTQEELSNTPFSRFVHPDDLAIVVERYASRMRAEASVGSLEFRVLTKDKEVIYAEINVAVTHWGGNPALLCLFRDVTDRKAAQEALQQSEQRYRDLVEDIDDIIYVMDGNGKFLFANGALLKFSGVDESQINTTHFADMITSESYEQIKGIYKRQLNGEDVGPFEMNFKSKNGEIVTVETRERLVWRDGRVTEVHGIGRDITERKRAERALRESEERYRRLVEVSPDGVLVHSGGKIVFANCAAADLIGAASAEDLFGRNIRDFIHPDFIATIVERVQRSLAEGISAPMMEEKFIRVDGTTIDGEAAAVPLTYKGEPAMLVIARDITDRKKAQRALVVREQELNNIFEFTGTAMLIVEEDMTIKKCNHELELLAGYRKEEIEGKMNWTDFVHPDELDRMADFYKARQNENAVAPRHYESRLIDRNGIVKHIYITVGFIPETKLTVVAALDITDRKRSENALRESEEKLRNLFDSSKDVIFLSTITGWFYDINQAGEEFFGFTRDELLTLDTQDIYKNENDRQDLHKAIETLGFVKDWEVTYKRKDGTFVDCLVTATLRKDREGNVIGYQGLIKDISDRKRLEEQLAAAKRMEAVGTLAGGMAHNFNNILVGIMGYSELLLGKKDPADPDYKALSIIHEGTVSASKLTKELLSIARGGDYSLVKLNLNTLIKRFLPLITGTLDKSINVKAYLADDLPSIEGDMSQIQQCLLNLCINARDAMPNGGNIVIETYYQYLGEDFVRAHLGTRVGDYAVVSVTDNGQGISEEHKPHIFEPFFSTKDLKRGTGLGLSTVWGIMKSHKGLITVYSEPDEGTTFKLYFPAISGQSYQPVPPQADQVVLGNETILLIDDEPIVRETWRDALSERGFRVIVAEDGAQGIDAFLREKDFIDLVILDFIMPVLGGGETFLKLKELKPDVKVLISSGYGANDMVWDSIGTKAEGFIQKPCSISYLIEKVNELVKSG